MKKIFLGLVALILAVGFTAFTKLSESRRANIDFKFIPPNGSETLYETPASWDDFPASPSCTAGPDPCVIRVDEAKLQPYRNQDPSRTDEENLALYLQDQVGGTTDYLNAAAAVNAMKIQSKP